MTESKMIILHCSDGKTFEIEERIAVQSQTIKCMIEDDCANNPIPLPNVTGKVMTKVLEYCNKHAEHYAKNPAPSEVAEPSYPLVVADNADAAAEDPELKAWDAKFVKVELPALFELILAANYLNIKDLLDLTIQAAADKIKDKMPEEVRKIFHIENDFTPEEEEELRKQTAWAYENLSSDH